ncbi:uncharacterized protein LOC127153748 isoform X2 [Labeo rohita]|uniref:uncharacterized protein LOC127153748 isoform X2 n=1 Tax=Labeo rohita TaxID=84645 RepID=UPI0021E33E60|nr:uncharacterized protein LOC127153748 isoform X2 [Labeo rohita]
MIFGYFILTLCVLLVDGVFGDTDEAKSVLKGSAVTLENQEQYEVIQWYFNNIQIAQFDKDVGERCLYDGEGGIFRDRLKVDYETGSLTITNITSEHAGHYEAVIIRRQASGNHYSLHTSTNCVGTIIRKKQVRIADYTKKFAVNVNEHDKGSEKLPATSLGLPSNAVAGISVAVVMVVAVAAGIIYHCCRNSRKNMEINREEEVL